MIMYAYNYKPKYIQPNVRVRVRVRVRLGLGLGLGSQPGTILTSYSRSVHIVHMEDQFVHLLDRFVHNFLLCSVNNKIDFYTCILVMFY